jgi:hypothetical protein
MTLKFNLEDPGAKKERLLSDGTFPPIIPDLNDWFLPDDLEQSVIHP